MTWIKLNYNSNVRKIHVFYEPKWIIFGACFCPLTEPTHPAFPSQSPHPCPFGNWSDGPVGAEEDEADEGGPGVADDLAHRVAPVPRLRRQRRDGRRGRWGNRRAETRDGQQTWQPGPISYSAPLQRGCCGPTPTMAPLGVDNGETVSAGHSSQLPSKADSRQSQGMSPKHRGENPCGAQAGRRIEERLESLVEIGHRDQVSGWIEWCSGNMDSIRALGKKSSRERWWIWFRMQP